MINVWMVIGPVCVTIGAILLVFPAALFGSYLGLRSSKLGKLTGMDKEPLLHGFVKYLRPTKRGKEV